MYDYKLNTKEIVKLISDNTTIYTEKDKKVYTTILTNQRLLILDYPSSYHNSLEELRIINKMTYIKKKEVISSINLKDIVSINKESNYYQIKLKNDKYLNLNDKQIITYLNRRGNHEKNKTKNR